MAQPSKERWHKRPTALLGGIAIYLAIAIPLASLADFKGFWGQAFGHALLASTPVLGPTLWVGATFLFILGLLDDFINIKPHSKLVGQILVASMVAFMGFRLHWFTSLTLDTMVTIFWIVGITNAFNLIDNMDGLCAGIGTIAAVFLGFIFWGHPNEASLVAGILAGSLAGFLIYNFNPASIFMGDSGSLPIGFILAVLSLYYSELPEINTVSLYFLPVLILMVPVFDTVLVATIRILSGRKASTGGRDHTSHRLVLMGFNEKGAVLFLYVVAFFSGLSATFAAKTDLLTSPSVIIPTFLAFVLMGVYLAQLRVYPEKEFSLLRNKAYTPILIELTYKRQLLLVSLDFGLVAFAYYLSYRLRFDSVAFGYYFKIFLKSLPAVIACKMISFFWIGIYRAIWKYTSLNDVLLYIKASCVATVLSIVAVTFLYRFKDFSKGIFLIDWLLTTTLLISTRGSFRFFLDTIKRKTLHGETILIYGAGRAGEIVMREILHNPKLKLKPAGFIDDDPIKVGKKLQGIPIIGTLNDIERFIEKHAIRGILLAFRQDASNNFERLKLLCKQNHLFLKKFSIEVDDVDLEE